METKGDHKIRISNVNKDILIKNSFNIKLLIDMLYRSNQKHKI